MLFRSRATTRSLGLLSRLPSNRSASVVRDGTVYFTDPSFGLEGMDDSPLRELVLTDTVPLPAGKRIAKITTLSIAPLIGEAIKRIHRGESVGALFSSEVEFTQEMLLWEDGVARKLDTRNEPGHAPDAADSDPDDAPADAAGDDRDPPILTAAQAGDR